MSATADTADKPSYHCSVWGQFTIKHNAMTSFSLCLAPGARHPPWTNSAPSSPFCFLTELLKMPAHTRLCAQQRDKLMRFVSRIFWRYCHPLQTQRERRRRQLPLSGLNRPSVRAKSALLTLSSGSSSLQANRSQKTRLAISWAIWKSSKPLQRSVGWMQIQRRLNTLVQV